VAETSSRVSRCAWAKVNLHLEVTGRRPDGYHELDSLIVFAGLGDRLDFRPAEALEIGVTGPWANQVPAGAENLVARAAQALAAHAGVTPAARIDLDKRLPVAAGIGSGSADAAATLAGLAALWGLSPAPGDLMRIAAGLGADVPVCLFGRPAVVRGIGEVIERAPPLPGGWLVLANPGLPLATGRVFEARRGAYSPARPRSLSALDIGELAAELAERSNDLQPAALRLAPEIGRVLERLGAAPGALLARMSGSGSTCFALFATAPEARAAAGAIGRDHPDWWYAAAPILHGKLSGPWRG
jgi:4-diphosphocytidyl-2-C-methyl-D-erythritol kinase